MFLSLRQPLGQCGFRRMILFPSGRTVSGLFVDPVKRRFSLRERSDVVESQRFQIGVGILEVICYMFRTVRIRTGSDNFSAERSIEPQDRFGRTGFFHVISERRGVQFDTVSRFDQML